MSTGNHDIFGASWLNCMRRPTCSAKQTVDAVEGGNATQHDVPACTGKQLADVYHIAMPNDPSKPYAADVVNLFVQAGAVDWAANSFKSHAVADVEAIIEAHGDGLNETQ
jgi:hypothetical protein